MNEDENKKDNAYECQRLCQETSGCKRFVYITDTYNGVHGTGIRKNCILKDQNPIYKVVKDIVSGPAKCPSESNRFVYVYVCFQICI